MSSLLQAIRARLGGAPIEPLDLDRELRTWALRTGMGPLLCGEGDGGSGDPGVHRRTTREWPELEAARLEALVRAHVLGVALSEVLRAAASSSLGPPVLFKGASTAFDVYPSPHLRAMRDLDLLVLPEDLEPLESALRALGFEQRSHNSADYYRGHHHGMPFLDVERDVWIEPHTALFPARDPLAGSEVFSRSTWTTELDAGDLDGEPVYRFSPELQVLYTACHWSGDLEPVASLPPLVDMSLILRRHADAFDWERFFGWLDDPRVRARTIPVLAFLVETGLAEVGNGEAAALRRETRKHGRATVSLQHRFIRRYCFEGSAPGRPLSANNLEVLWAAMSDPGTLASRLARTAWRILFPPENEGRYSLRFQLSRLLKRLRGNKGGTASENAGRSSSTPEE